MSTKPEHERFRFDKHQIHTMVILQKMFWGALVLFRPVPYVLVSSNPGILFLLFATYTCISQL